MITFDAEYSVIVHFEIDEKQALEQGGINYDTLRKNCSQFSDWILAAINDNVELGDNDTITVMPIEQKLKANGNKIELESAESYNISIAENAQVNFETEEITDGENQI